MVMSVHEELSVYVNESMLKCFFCIHCFIIRLYSMLIAVTYTRVVYDECVRYYVLYYDLFMLILCHDVRSELWFVSSHLLDDMSILVYVYGWLVVLCKLCFQGYDCVYSLKYLPVSMMTEIHMLMYVVMIWCYDYSHYRFPNSASIEF